MNNDVGEIFRTDAKAEGKDVVVGGWECRGDVEPAQARWFSTRLTESNCAWLHCRGEPFRVIAALELYATLFGVMAFMPQGGALEGVGTISGTATTGNRGNSFAIASLCQLSPQ